MGDIRYLFDMGVTIQCTACGGHDRRGDNSEPPDTIEVGRIGYCSACGVPVVVVTEDGVRPIRFGRIYDGQDEEDGK